MEVAEIIVFRELSVIIYTYLAIDRNKFKAYITMQIAISWGSGSQGYVASSAEFYYPGTKSSNRRLG